MGSSTALLPLGASAERFSRLRSAAIEHMPQAQVRGTTPPIDTAFALDCLGNCLGALRDLCGLAEGLAESAPSDVPGAKDGLFMIADCCFMAQSELRPLVTRLQGLTALDPIAHVTVESAYRKIRRICTRVIGLLSPLTHTPIDVTREQKEVVETSVAVRRLYARFRRSLVYAVDSDESVLRALRLAAVAIAQLVGHVDASDVRIQDAQLLRGLQDRILGWVREKGSPMAGRRIHADLVALSDLLRLINHRQELKAHDAEVIRTAMAFANHVVQAPDREGETLLAMLASLDGLDDVLDELKSKAPKPMTSAHAEQLYDRLNMLAGGNDVEHVA